MQTCISSPPYWGLRNYSTVHQVWGGDKNCDHVWVEKSYVRNNDKTAGEKQNTNIGSVGRDVPILSGVCSKCSAWKGELGGEPTPELFVRNMVDVFREVKRVLKKDGTLWLNLGDTYASSWGSNRVSKIGNPSRTERAIKMGDGLKEKDLVGIPWSVAKALRDPYYSGRIKAERDRAWMAAMIDGEGSICGFEHERKDGGGMRTGINICITNSNTELLDEAQRIFPASRAEHCNPGDGHLGQVPTWRWLVHGAENKAMFLREIYPYLIAKRQQAIIGYTMACLMIDAKKLGKTDQAQAVREKRLLLMRLLSQTNHAQIVDIPNWCIEPPNCYEQGWYLRSDIIWQKPNPMPESVTDRCTKSHEYIFLLTKSGKYYYDADAIKEPMAISSGSRLAQDIENQKGSDRVPGKTNGNMKAVSHKNMQSKGQSVHSMHKARLGLLGSGFDGHSGNYDKNGNVIGNGMANKRSVWSITTKPYSGAHFATFPTEIPEICIKAGTKKGDTVLDPFCGSGTTGEVALRLDRNFIGCELNPKYVKDLIEPRLHNVSPLFKGGE